MMGRRRGLLKILLAGYALFPAWAAAGEILKNVQVEEQGDSLLFRAELAASVEYVKHFPTARGKILQIQLLASESELDADGWRRRETLQPDSPAGIVTEVIYEGNVKGGPFLVLRFNSIVAFKIREGKGKIVEVRLEREGAPAAGEIAGVLSGNTEDQAMANLLEQGRRDLLEGRYNEAVFRFTQILQRPGNPSERDAKEYLGVARERLGQYDLARAEYQEYLKAYPEDDRTRTVQQRLMEVQSREVRVADLRKSREAARTVAARGGDGDPSVQSDYFGRISSMYMRGNTVLNEKTVPAINAFNNSFDFNGRRRTTTQETRVVFNGSFDMDMRDESQTSSLTAGQNLARLRSAYYEYRGRQNGLQWAVGRQSLSKGSMGRFNGAYVSYKPNSKVMATVAGGLPVDFKDSFTFDTNASMASANVDFLEIVQNMSGSLYLTQQYYETFLDRRALGGDLRYLVNKFNVSGAFDYDVHYQVWNNLMATGGLQVDKLTNANLYIDWRRSPMLMTRNAASGLTSLQESDLPNSERQLWLPEGTLTEDNVQYLRANPTLTALRNIGLSDAEIERIASEMSGRSFTGTLSFTRELAELGPDYQLSASLTYSNYESMPIFRRIENADDPRFGEFDFEYVTSQDYSLYANLMIRNLWKQRDMQTITLRTAFGDLSQRNTLGVSSRIPYLSMWNFDLRMMVDRSNDQKSNTTYKYTPSVRAEYRVLKSLTLDSEFLIEWTRAASAEANSRYYYMNLGMHYLY